MRWRTTGVKVEQASDIGFLAKMMIQQYVQKIQTNPTHYALSIIHHGSHQWESILLWNGIRFPVRVLGSIDSPKPSLDVYTLEKPV